MNKIANWFDKEPPGYYIGLVVLIVLGGLMVKAAIVAHI